MYPQPDTPAEDRFEDTMGLLLRTGVFISAAFVLVGGILYLIHYGATPPAYQTFQPAPESQRTISGIIRMLLDARGEGTILAGVIILIATPVFRVVYSLFGFLKLRDRLYVAISLLVLAILLFGIFGQPV